MLQGCIRLLLLACIDSPKAAPREGFLCNDWSNGTSRHVVILLYSTPGPVRSTFVSSHRCAVQKRLRVRDICDLRPCLSAAVKLLLAFARPQRDRWLTLARTRRELGSSTPWPGYKTPLFTVRLDPPRPWLAVHISIHSTRAVVRRSSACGALVSPRGAA